jgi:two-component system cell cycle sensor histidine kinase/response regulator CckA
MRTILLVDDEEDIRELVAKMLRYGGFEVLEADSGAQAGQLYADRPVDLVVTDVVMAGESGPELAERLRRTSPELKVLYISGCPNVRHEAWSQQASFLPKPFTIAEIVGSVSTLLMH